MPKIRLGKDATISGAGLDNDQIRNVSVDFAKAEADVSVRGGGGYRATVGTLKECQITAEIVVHNDEDLDGVRDAFESGDPEDLTISDVGGAISQPFEVMSLSVTQELEGAIVGSVTLKTTAEADA